MADRSKLDRRPAPPPPTNRTDAGLLAATGIRAYGSPVVHRRDPATGRSACCTLAGVSTEAMIRTTRAVSCLLCLDGAA